MRISILFVFLFYCCTSMYGQVPSQVQSPFKDGFTQSSNCGSQPNSTSSKPWSFWQRCGSGHEAGGGIGGANDLRALDINKNSPSHNSDAGQAVYAVEDGFVQTFDGWGGSSFGQLLLEHTNSNGSKWYSGYLHMSNIISKSNGRFFRKGDKIGEVGRVGANNDHLHFAVYNRLSNDELESVSTTIVEQGTTSGTTIEIISGIQAQSTNGGTNVLVQGEAQAIAFKVKNISSQYSERSYKLFIVNQQTGATNVVFQETFGLNPNQEIWKSVTGNTQSAPGDYQLILKAGPGSLSNISMSSSSVATSGSGVNPVDIQIISSSGGGSTLDLTLSNPSIDYNTRVPEENQIARCIVNVANHTSTVSGYVGYYLSTNSILDNSDTFISQRSFNLQSNETSDSQGAGFNVPTIEGTYYVIMVVDYEDQITESNENNNTVVSPPFTVAHTVSTDISSLSLDSYDNSRIINVESSGAVQISDNADWVTTSVGSGNGDFGFRVDVSANNTSNSRTGIITLQSEGSAFATITVTQQAGASDLTISPSSITFTPNPRDNFQTIQVSTSGDWTATPNASWITSQHSAVGGGGVPNNISVEDNPSYSTRTGTVTFTSGSVTKILTVTQEGVQWSITPTSYTAPDHKDKDVQISMSTNAYWETSGGNDWLSVTGSGGPNNSTSFRVFLQPNYSGSQRTETVNIEAVGLGLSQSFQVTQPAFVPQLFVDKENITVNSDGGQVSISVTSNDLFTISENADWLSTSLTSGSNNVNFTIDVEGNAASESRTIPIRITMNNDGGGGSDLVIEVTQEGVPNFSISESTLTFLPSDNSYGQSSNFQVIQVESNTPWTTNATGCSWCNLDNSSADAGAAVTIVAGENISNSDRTGTIIFQAGSISRTLTIIQEGIRITLSPNNYEATSHKSENFDVNMTDVNVNWEVHTNQDWIGIPSSFSGNPTNFVDFNVQLEPNYTANERVGSVDVFVANIQTSRSIQITQPAFVPQLSVDKENVTVTSDGGQVSISVTSNDLFTISENADWLSTSLTSGSNNVNFIIDVEENTTSESRTIPIQITMNNDGSGASDLVINVTQEGKESSIAGDLNGDGAVNVFDLQMIISCISTNNPFSSCPDADLNGDGAVNIFDLQMIIAIITGG